MVEKPEGLEPRGSALWDAVTAKQTFDAAGYALLEDACRTADIIARLTKKLKAPHCEWVRMAEDVEEDRAGNKKIFVIVDKALLEIRQQRLAMRQLLAQLKIGMTVGGETTASVGDQFWADMEADYNS